MENAIFVNKVSRNPCEYIFCHRSLIIVIFMLKRRKVFFLLSLSTNFISDWRNTNHNIDTLPYTEIKIASKWVIKSHKSKKNRLKRKKTKSNIDLYLQLLGVGLMSYLSICVCLRIRVITKLPNTEQSSKGKGKTHNSTNKQNQSTTGKLGNPQWPWLGTGISKEMVGWIRFYGAKPPASIAVKRFRLSRIVVSYTYYFMFLLCLRHVYPMFPVSLDCQFLIPPSIFFNVYYKKKRHWKLKIE